MNLRKLTVGNRMCDVITLEKYMRSPDSYTNNSTLIEQDGYALPIVSRAQFDADKTLVGICPGSLISYYRNPSSKSDEDRYKIDGNPNLVDFQNVESYHEVIEKQKMVRDLENEILTNSDNITELKHGDNDTPAMGALKDAINLKHCNIKLYEQKFDGNFNNDIRILSEDSITLPKLVKFADALDMKLELTIQDKKDNVPNPIGKTIKVELTGGD